MPWSTREIANLAGTAVSTIRYYHSVGLLEMPARQPNGYKDYQVRHLVRLLRIRRLTELGMSLEQIAALGDENEPPHDALRILEAELAGSIARLQLVRDELSQTLEHAAPAGLPPGFSGVAENTTVTDRAMLLVYSLILGLEEMASLRAMLAAPPTPDQLELARLTEDADEATRARLAGRLAATMRPVKAENPWTLEPGLGSTRSPDEVRRLLHEAFASLYNSAQLDVLARVRHA